MNDAATLDVERIPARREAPIAWERWMFHYLRRKGGLPPLRPT